MTEPAPWRTPTRKDIEESNITRFLSYLNKRHGFKLRDYWDFHKWTLDDPNLFYKSLWDFKGLIGDVGPEPFFDGSKPAWPPYNTLPNLHLNFAENILLSNPNARSTSKIATITCIEAVPGQKQSRTLKSLSWNQLYEEVFWTSEALKEECGLKDGDVVTFFGPNNSEAIVACLATTSFGGIFSSSASELGPKAVLERFEQISPKVLFTADETLYAGKVVDIYPKLLQILSSLPTIETVVVVGQLQHNRSPLKLPQIKENLKHIKFRRYDEFIKLGKDIAEKNQRKEIRFWRGPAYSPLWVLYSSGTTGKPKSLVHSAGGMLMAACVSSINGEVHSNSCLMQFSTLAWMMWNASLMTMLHGTKIICYEGSPLIPLSILWDLVEEHKVTCVGVSPRYLQVLQQYKYHPQEKHNLSALECILTAGSPLRPELYDFIRDNISPSIYISNATGGTDICGAFIGGARTLPIYQAGQIQVPYPGINVEAWDENGKSVWNKEGYMIITNAIPNMPMKLWGDPKHERLRSSYYDTFPKVVWNQSDWIIRYSHGGGYLVLGRSDGVLNPAGVRFGSAELYDIVEEVPGVADSLAVGQKLGDGDERVILFVKTQNDKPLDEQITSTIRQSIIQKLSRRHVPAKIIQCKAIPYTINMKKMEVAVKKLVNGIPIQNLNISACENPQSLAFFIDNPEIRLPSLPKAKL